MEEKEGEGKRKRRRNSRGREGREERRERGGQEKGEGVPQFTFLATPLIVTVLE